MFLFTEIVTWSKMLEPNVHTMKAASAQIGGSIEENDKQRRWGRWR